ncbi:MAG: GH116 family glycosyl-hydrolase [Lachnospirales bacterium]
MRKNSKGFSNKAINAKFLLGGIGTGNISVGARGELTDYEIFGKPNKGYKPDYSFFCIRVENEDGSHVEKILESEFTSMFNKPFGYASEELAGIPRFEKTNMVGEYPFVWVDLIDSKMPINVVMESFTPFIPLDVKNSSIPCAIINYKVKNISKEKIDVSVVGTMSNFCSFNNTTNSIEHDVNLENNYVEYSLKGIQHKNNLQGYEYMETGLFLDTDNVFYSENWLQGSWWDGMQDFWNDFTSDGILENKRKSKAIGNSLFVNKNKVSSIGSKVNLLPNEEFEFKFILAWYKPWRVKSWNNLNRKNFVKNRYAKFYTSIKDIIEYLHNNYNYLYNMSMKFHDAIYYSTLPQFIIDSIANNITVIRSTTCFQLYDGTFLSWEGSGEKNGSCEGNCTHVWNYAQALAYLFPELEKNMRRTEFLKETDKIGKMNFRATSIFNESSNFKEPAADGQLGCIIKFYRDWLITGDDKYLKELWPKVKLVMKYSENYWCKNAPVLTEKQHNTYDIEFYGINTLTNSIYLTALLACEKVAQYLDDYELSGYYKRKFNIASNYIDKVCFNGEYYIQHLENINEYKYQYGNGCLSDQILGQQLANSIGLGHILNPKNINSAIKSIYDNNFKTSLRDTYNLQRTFALNDESGLLLCSWNNTNRPEFPFVYSDEVWTGVEYQVASNLIQEGFISEAFNIIKAIRNRYDGIKRNPWCEIECGNHYVRSLSSFAVLLALNGQVCNLPNNEIIFSPTINEDFTSFFICGECWGIIEFKLSGENKELKTKILYGNDNITFKVR